MTVKNKTHPIRVSDLTYNRIFDRRDAKLKTANAVIAYALDCMDNQDLEESEIKRQWNKIKELSKEGGEN